MALEWVRNNVRYFGGINETVAVMGSGAGGASVHLLTMSPKTRGASIYPDDQCKKYLSLFLCYSISYSLQRRVG